MEVSTDRELLTPGPRHKLDATYNVQAALFDVDNTLVANDSPGLPSARFRNAVEASKGKIAVALATARPLSKVEHILDYIEVDGLSILCNGAQIVNSKDKAVVAEWPIAIETCIDLTSILRSKGLAFWINDDGVDYFPGSSGNSSYERLSDIWDKNSPRLEAPNYRPRKPFVVNVHNISDTQVKSVEKLVADYNDTNITTLISHEASQPDGTMLYELFIVNERANKKDALAELARLQNLKLENLLAVGDGRNDAVLVDSAGVGIAMGNSAKETLAVATFIAPNREDDGAAIALEYCLENFVSDQ